jgi:hypothetical protein
MGEMVPLAPRYDPRLLTLVAELDDHSEPIAEINRRIGVAAVQLGLIKPSYVHIRRFVLEKRDREDEERERREAVREVVTDVTGALLAGRVPTVYEVLDRFEESKRSKRVSGSEPQTRAVLRGPPGRNEPGQANTR